MITGIILTAIFVRRMPVIVIFTVLNPSSWRIWIHCTANQSKTATVWPTQDTRQGISINGLKKDKETGEEYISGPW